MLRWKMRWVSRRSVAGTRLSDFFTQPDLLINALSGAQGNAFAALRYDTWLKCQHRDPMPVHVVVAQTEVPNEVVVELLPLSSKPAKIRRSACSTRRRPTKS